MPFVNLPGRQYTTPVDWHPDPVYRIFGPTGTHNHTPDYISNVSGPVVLAESATAIAGFDEPFGGPIPGTAAAQCAWGMTSLGLTGPEATWTGSCPDPVGPTGARGTLRGSSWSTVVEGPSIFQDTSSATSRISGWLLRPWMIALGDNPWMDDDDLEDEYNAAVALGWPGPGWFLEVEHYYPAFVRFQVAPDETVSTSGQIRTESAIWLRNTSGWSYQGTAGLVNLWDTGAVPSGTPLDDGYAGGLADWVNVPDEWQPEQDFSDLFFTGWVDEPTTEEEIDEANIPLTLVSETTLSGAYPGDNTSGGRTGQWLMVRVEYNLPRIRWYREATGFPPQRVIGRGDGLTSGASRVIGAGNTRQGGNVLGGYL